jgi:hypothetical protein
VVLLFKSCVAETKTTGTSALLVNNSQDLMTDDRVLVSIQASKRYPVRPSCGSVILHAETGITTTLLVILSWRCSTDGRADRSEKQKFFVKSIDLRNQSWLDRNPPSAKRLTKSKEEVKLSAKQEGP